MKQEFIKKWSSWWRLQKHHELLTNGFKIELDAIIRQEVANTILSLPADIETNKTKIEDRIKENRLINSTLRYILFLTLCLFLSSLFYQTT